VSSPAVASLLAGTIFAALHWPNPLLIPLTFIGGATMAWFFARERNIIPLAIGQGILGTLVWWAFPVAWHHGMRVGPVFYTFIRDRLAGLQFKWPYFAAMRCFGGRCDSLSHRCSRQPAIAKPHLGQAPALRRLVQKRRARSGELEVPRISGI